MYKLYRYPLFFPPQSYLRKNKKVGEISVRIKIKPRVYFIIFTSHSGLMGSIDYDGLFFFFLERRKRRKKITSGGARLLTELSWR